MDVKHDPGHFNTLLAGTSTPATTSTELGGPLRLNCRQHLVQEREASSKAIKTPIGQAEE